MPKGELSMLKGPIYNVPVDVTDVCNTPKRPLDSNRLVIVKLKWNLV